MRLPEKGSETPGETPSGVSLRAAIIGLFVGRMVATLLSSAVRLMTGVPG